MYAELASRFPQTGGEVTYISAVFGKQSGFIVGWLLTLAYLSNLVFEGVVLAWLLEILWPELTGPTLYVVFGQPIGVGSLILALFCGLRSEEHTSELQSLMRISYAVFCLKKKKKYTNHHTTNKQYNNKITDNNT